MQHLQQKPMAQTAYHSEWQRALEASENLICLWTADTHKEMQQRLWLTAVKMIALDMVLSDQFELVSARTVRLILMPRRVGAIRQERRRG